MTLAKIRTNFTSYWILALMLIPLLVTGCGQETPTDMADTDDGINPFFKNYDTPFQIPPFSKIRLEHYAPAFEQGMQEQLAEIDAIANNTELPTFNNTLAALEGTGKLLDKVSYVFFNLEGADTNEQLQQLDQVIAPKLSAHSDAISLNDKLFQRIKTLYDQRKKLDLTTEQAKLLTDTYKGFVRQGVLLKEKDKQQLIAINSELSTLTTQFGQNLLKETNRFELILNENQLDGLPQNIRDAAKVAAAEKMAKATADNKEKYADKYVFTPHRSSMYPFLTYSTERDLRKQIYLEYIRRGDNDNEADNKNIVKKIVVLRAERANLLGYLSHADYVLEENMLNTPEKVNQLLDQLWTPALNRANDEVDAMQKIVRSEGGRFEVQGWDWWHYAEKIRNTEYAFNEAQLSPYLSLDNVLNGAFAVATKLWGLTFSEIVDIDLYHPDARAWEVKDKDGSHIGVFIGDFYTRSSKRGGAWMSIFQQQSNYAGRVRPIVINVCNFPPPVGDIPSLLTMEHVVTLFHEFGHALHGLVSNTNYPSMAGTSGPRDFTEFPAQIYEHWARHPQMMKQYAKHYETGEPITDELIQTYLDAQLFNEGFANTEYLAASILDLEYHLLEKGDTIDDVNAFETELFDNIGLIESITSRYRSTYFAHIFAGGYSAGYYSYIQSAVLDSDGFAAFQATGDIFDQELADKYRKNILEAGATRNAMDLYVSFRGRKPKINALLRARGLY